MVKHNMKILKCDCIRVNLSLPSNRLMHTQYVLRHILYACEL